MYLIMPATTYLFDKFNYEAFDDHDISAIVKNDDCYEILFEDVTHLNSFYESACKKYHNFSDKIIKSEIFIGLKIISGSEIGILRSLSEKLYDEATEADWVVGDLCSYDFDKLKIVEVNKLYSI